MRTRTDGPCLWPDPSLRERPTTFLSQNRFLRPTWYEEEEEGMRSLAGGLDPTKRACIECGRRGTRSWSMRTWVKSKAASVGFPRCRGQRKQTTEFTIPSCGEVVRIILREFPGPAWAVASCSTDPQAGGTP